MHSGTVYTDAVSFVTALVSMRLRLSFTWRRLSSLSEPCRFEYAFKSGAFSKRDGFEVVQTAKTHRFKNGPERNWLAGEVNMVNLAWSAVLCCTITTLICGLTSLLQLSCILLDESHTAEKQAKMS